MAKLVVSAEDRSAAKLWAVDSYRSLCAALRNDSDAGRLIHVVELDDDARTYAVRELIGLLRGEP